MRDLSGAKGPSLNQIAIVAGIERETEGKPGDRNTAPGEVNSKEKSQAPPRCNPSVRESTYKVLTTELTRT